MKKLLQSKTKGSAIVLVLLAVVILSATGLGLISLGMRSRIFAAQSISEIAARCAADAGMARAVFEMNEKLKVKPWDGSTLPEVTDEVLPNSESTCSYTVRGDLGSGLTIESIGKSGRAQKEVTSSLQLEGPFESAIFTDGTIILKSNTLVDGYSSADSSLTDVEVQIGTNSTVDNSIVLNSGITVDGEILVGPGGDVANVIQDLGATTGQRYALAEEVEFQPIILPELVDKGTYIRSHGTTLQFSDADSGQYTYIRLKKAANPGILEITSGDVVLYITGNVELGQSCEIVVREGASLELYLDGNLDSANSAGINNLNSPVNFSLYGTGTEQQQFDLKAKGDFSGAVYAPNADLTIMAGGDVYGSFMGSSFEMKSGGNFYYDEALRNVSVDDVAVQFVVEQWSEE
jgi:hypothetical protein